MIHYVGLFLGGIAAVAYETLCRSHVGGSFWTVFPWGMVSALLISFGVWSSMNLNSSLIAGIITWTVVTTAMRLASTLFVLHESPTPGAWAGFCLLVLAQVLVKVIK